MVRSGAELPLQALQRVGQSRVEWSRSSRAVRGLLRGCSRSGVGRSHNVSAGTQARRNCNQSCLHWPEAFGGLAFILSDVRQRWPSDCPKLSMVVAGRGALWRFRLRAGIRTTEKFRFYLPPPVGSTIVNRHRKIACRNTAKIAIENVKPLTRLRRINHRHPSR